VLLVLVVMLPVLLLVVLMLLPCPLVWCWCPLLLQQGVQGLLHGTLLWQQQLRQLNPGAWTAVRMWALQQHLQLPLQQPWQLRQLLSLQPAHQWSVA
jgi:hypothetical protein